MSRRGGATPLSLREKTVIKRMFGLGYSIREMAEEVGRAKSTVFYELYPDRKGQRGAQEDELRIRVQRREESNPTPDAGTLAEREYRLSIIPRDLTARLMGDPPKGYSALERRAR